MDDRAKGTLKEAEGKVTGDESREQEGKDQQTVGKVKDAAGGVKESVKDRLD